MEIKEIAVTPLLPENTPKGIPHGMEDWSHLMDALTRHPIDHSPWIGYTQEPKASFAIGYTKDAILLKFYVTERDPRVTFYETNDPVYQDSCVEFFITFDPAGICPTPYYNLEFNAIGTCLIGYGPGRAERSAVPAERIQTIGVHSSLRSSESQLGNSVNNAPASGQTGRDGNTDWTLTLKIPLTVFMYDTIKALAGTRARANFYKCGDECIAPHYLTWNNILSPGPNFHQPGYFGELLFL